MEEERIELKLCYMKTLLEKKEKRETFMLRFVTRWKIIEKIVFVLEAEK